MQPISYWIVTMLLGVQAPQVDIVGPVDPAITVQRIGGGSFSERTLALIPYTLVLTNNTTHDITGFAVVWEPVGGPPQTLVSDSYTSKQPVVAAKGRVVLTPPGNIEVADAINIDRTGRRVAGISPDKTQERVSRVIITVDAVIFDDGVVLGPDHSGLVSNITARTELSAAEAKWAANKPQVYEFTFKQICFCPPPPPGKAGSEPIVFHVQDGIGALTGAWADRPQARQGMDKYSTVEKQFAFIRAALATRPYRTEIEYDPDEGYPRRVYIDPQKNAADDEYGFEVQGFRSLSRR
jgi:hypothetical protein